MTFALVACTFHVGGVLRKDCYVLLRTLVRAVGSSSCPSLRRNLCVFRTRGTAGKRDARLRVLSLPVSVGHDSTRPLLRPTTLERGTLVGTHRHDSNRGLVFSLESP